jgi:hypothetical protein
VYEQEDSSEHESSSPADHDSEHENDGEHESDGEQEYGSEQQLTHLEGSSELEDDSTPGDSSEQDQVAVSREETDMIDFFTIVTGKRLSLVQRYSFSTRIFTTRRPGALYSWSEPSYPRPVSYLAS